MIKLFEPEIPNKSKEYVNKALDTGWLSYTGSYVKQLEDQVGSYIGTKNNIALSNGTVALWLALKALGIGYGDFVAVPTMTFVGTVNAIIHTGATPVFIECDEDLQMHTEYIKAALDTMRLRAMIPVHMLGNTCDMDKICEICNSLDTFIIEDAAQALGSKYLDNKTKVGKRWETQATMFSFSFNKLIAAGQGGMIVTKHEHLGTYIKYLSLQSKDDADMYIHNEAGFNAGMSNINAALACGQMEDIISVLEKKNRVRNKYLELLGEENMYYQPNGNGWLNAYKCKEPYKDVVQRCSKAGIQVRPLFYPNHLQKGFKKYPYFGNRIAEQKYNYTVCLPSSTTLTDKNIKEVVKLVRGDK